MFNLTHRTIYIVVLKHIVPNCVAKAFKTASAMDARVGWLWQA